MTLWLRLLILILTAPFKPRVTLSQGVVQRRRVLPSDIDLNFHMTNSRYASLADLARLGLMIRSGLLRAAIKNDWRPMLVASKIRYRREIKLLRAIRVEMRLRWWNEASAVFEVRFITRGRDGDILAAIALERGGIYSRREKRFVPVEALFDALGLERVAPPEATPDILAFVAAEDQMRRVG